MTTDYTATAAVLKRTMDDEIPAHLQDQAQTDPDAPRGLPGSTPQREPWDPRPGESERSYVMFRDWLDAWLASSGSTTITAWAKANHARCGLAIITIQQRASRHRWLARAKAYRGRLDRVRLEGARQGAREATAQMGAMWREILDWCVEEIDRMRADGTRLTPRELLGMADKATEAIRLLSDQPTERLAVDLSGAETTTLEGLREHLIRVREESATRKTTH